MPEEKRPDSLPETPKEVKTLLSWESPSRPFKRRDYRYYQTIALLLLAVAVIAIVIQEFLFIGVLLALFFVLYVLGTVEPEGVEHKVTNQGITTAGRSYIWNELSDFWFTERHGAVVLNVGTKIRFPGRLIMLVPYIDRDRVKEVLVKYLPYREVAPENWMDNAISWFYAKLPPQLR